MKKITKKATTATTHKVNVATVLKSIEQKAAPIMRKLADFQITTQAEFEKAGLLMGELKGLGTVAKEEELKITRPLKEATDAARAHFKPFTVALENLQQSIKSKMVLWVDKQEKEKQRLAVKLETGEIKKVSTFLRKSDDLTAAATSGHSTTRKIKVLVCVDEKKTPREYLIPDTDKIKVAIIAGEIVPGWKVELQTTIAI